MVMSHRLSAPVTSRDTESVPEKLQVHLSLQARSARLKRCARAKWGPPHSASWWLQTGEQSGALTFLYVLRQNAFWKSLQDVRT